MKLRQLQCVLAVVQNGFSVTAAAEKLHMTQPAVSKQIKLFEDMLGVQIFKRNSKSFTGLTPLGDEVLSEIDKVLQGVENIRQLSVQSQEYRLSQLYIATTNTLARYRLPDYLPYMHEKYPNMPLNIMEGTNTQILEWVENQKADFGWFSAISLVPYFTALRKLIYLPANTWESVLVVPKNHPLAVDAPKSLADVAKYPLITYVTSHRGPSGLMNAMQEIGVTARIVVTARNADMIKNYVRQGMGIGVIADMAYEPTLDNDLIMWPLSRWVKRFQTYLAWHQDKRLRKVHYDFIEQVIPGANRELVTQHIHRIQMGQDVEGWAI